MKHFAGFLVMLTAFIFLCVFLLGCAPTISCDKVANPPFGERLAVGTELRSDGPVTQRWLEQYTSVLESCGYK